MTTVVNNPGTTTDDSGAGVIIGVVIAVLIIVLFFAFALPYIRNGELTPGVPNTGSTGTDGGSANVNVQLPDTNGSGNSNSGGTGGSSY
ncbi:MAG: hypothetical protein V4481_01660 [Patescibacteria group bacterium]